MKGRPHLINTLDKTFNTPKTYHYIETSWTQCGGSLKIKRGRTRKKRWVMHPTITHRFGANFLLAMDDCAILFYFYFHYFPSYFHPFTLNLGEGGRPLLKILRGTRRGHVLQTSAFRCLCQNAISATKWSSQNDIDRPIDCHCTFESVSQLTKETKAQK